MKRIAKQNGIALLAFALLLVVGLSAVLVNKLETNTTFFERQLQNTEILKEAKQALIGYAVNFPIDKPEFGQGYLPCPNFSPQTDGAYGQARSSCNDPEERVGRLPFKTLEISEKLDASGEPLWYIVSEQFTNNPKYAPLNSESTTNLTVDGVNNIAAIIIAPGEAISNQSRSGEIDEDTIPTDILNYFEGENSNLNGQYVTSTQGDFNDRLIFITLDELMEFSEKQVLEYLTEALNNYYDDPDGDGNLNSNEFYPWLSPFANPDSSVFKSTLNTYEGHLPFHYSKPDPEPSNFSPIWNTFTTDLTIEWSSIIGATTVFTGTVEEDCLINLYCTDSEPLNGNIPTLTSSLATTAPVTCNWTDRESIDCVPVEITETFNNIYGCGGELIRSYTIDFPLFTVIDPITNMTITEPTTTNIRRRALAFSGQIANQNNAIQIQDNYTGTFNGTNCSSSPVTNLDVGSGSVSFIGSTTNADISIGNIRYDLDVDNGELSEWFITNEWYKYIYVAYSTSSIDGSPGECVNSSDCISLQNSSGIYSSNSRVVAIATGKGLSFQTRPSANLTDYLENENADTASDNLLEDVKPNYNYNDQLKVISEN